MITFALLPSYNGKSLILRGFVAPKKSAKHLAQALK